MASSYLSRTLGTATNRKIWTFSTWIKRSKITSTNHIFGASVNTSTYPALEIVFNSSGVFLLSEYNGSGYNIQLNTNRLFRDASAWYHIVVAVDTTQATASDRVKIYVNGVQETSFSTANYYSQNTDPAINNSSIHTIGKHPFGSESADLDALLSHFHFIDGTAYDADTFGETDATTGIWKPKTAPSVTYGTNGFFLKGENSGALGTDSSGNGNNFTVNGTPTQTIDTPSNVFATLNPLLNSITAFENGATSVGSTSDNQMAISTFGASQGGYYAEMKLGNSPNAGTGYAMRVGIVNLMTSNLSFLGMGGHAENASPCYGVMNVYSGNSNYHKMYNNGNVPSSPDTGISSTAGDIIMIAWKNDKLYMGKNGTWFNSGNPASETNPLWTLPSGGTWGVVVQSSLAGASDSEFNFGNGYFGTTAVASATTDESGLGIFEYDVPTGYYALCTKNINEQEYS